jgi:pimeloyl-ACP methyl ester carboxylesterase
MPVRGYGHSFAGMHSTPRFFAPSRILGLVAIGLVVAGLGYLRFAPDGEISVPAGARAGQLIMKPCHYGTDRGDYAADCGTLVVPENRRRHRSRLIALPVTRIRARSPHPLEPVFRLEGGPGLTNMDFSKASRFAGRRDVVLVGYRGVDGSSVLDCPKVTSAMRGSSDFLARDSLRAQAAEFTSCAKRLQDEGVDLAGYTLPQRVDDLEAARRALGYRQVNLLSESAGTRTAMIYAWRYPKSIYRSVMLAANPPGHFLWDSKTIDRQIRRYSELCSQADACGWRTDDLAGLIKRGAQDIPGRWGPLKIKKGNVRVATFFGLIDSGDEAAPLAAPMTLDSWLAAAHGDASGLWFQSLAASLISPRAQVWGDVAAVARADTNAADSHFSKPRDPGSIIGDPGSTFLWADGALAHAWPAAPDQDEYDRVRNSRVETLVIGGSLDFASPPENATRELMPHLPNGHQVILRNFGHTTDLWSEQTRASTHLINTFLDHGRVDTSLFRHRSIDFRPWVTQTRIAKGLAGSMLALALIMLVSLLWMPRRVKQRGRMGGRASVLLRSVLPIVLGLGGWSLTSLIVLTTAPSVPIDGELLVVFSMAMPIGLGIYWAWLHHDWPAETRRVGLAAAALSALVGGWLGFHAGAGLLVLVTTIAGAAAATNLALILVSVARDGAPLDSVSDLSSTQDRRLVVAQMRPGDDVLTAPRS